MNDGYYLKNYTCAHARTRTRYVWRRNKINGRTNGGFILLVPTINSSDNIYG